MFRDLIYHKGKTNYMTNFITTESIKIYNEKVEEVENYTLAKKSKRKTTQE